MEVICCNADKCNHNLCNHRKPHEHYNRCDGKCYHMDILNGEFIHCIPIHEDIEFIKTDEMEI